MKVSFLNQRIASFKSKELFKNAGTFKCTIKETENSPVYNYACAGHPTDLYGVCDQRNQLYSVICIHMLLLVHCYGMCHPDQPLLCLEFLKPDADNDWLLLWKAWDGEETIQWRPDSPWHGGGRAWWWPPLVWQECDPAAQYPGSHLRPAHSPEVPGHHQQWLPQHMLSSNNQGDVIETGINIYMLIDII